MDIIDSTLVQINENLIKISEGINGNDGNTNLYIALVKASPKIGTGKTGIFIV
jgi:hypothetical protein